jgi:hypothetical protein
LTFGGGAEVRTLQRRSQGLAKMSRLRHAAEWDLMPRATPPVM